MTAEEWLGRLTTELHRRGVAPDAVVAEAAHHLRESGQAPERVFGPPAAYAAAVAESLLGPGVEPPGWVRPAAAGEEPGVEPPGAVRLEARGITKRYAHRTVLDGVDLTVRAGEVVAVVGANGCGKSTLLRICAGLTSPDAGAVHVRGRLGYCPQEGGTVERLTPDEHFVLIGAGRGTDRATARRQGRTAAAVLDWPGVDRSPVAGKLSGGTRQKLNLIMSGLGDPDVLLLDEPYQGFDKGSYLDFWQQVWRWRTERKAVVVVTHLLSELNRVDNVLELGR